MAATKPFWRRTAKSSPFPLTTRRAASGCRSAAGTATWTDRSYDLADLPITDLVRDDKTGDLYAASDFGVMKLANGGSTWTEAGGSLPRVEVSALTIVPNARLLYAATHGRSAWKLTLP